MLALFTQASATILRVDTPPLLSSPVFSLSTLCPDGTTNMNMLTYATPVGIRPQRLWAISLYLETRTHANWLLTATGVLQQLTTEHAPLTWVLGGTSGAKVDKATACEELGMPWVESEECGAELLLPGCATYCRLVQQGPLIDAGSHAVAICRVEDMFASDSAAPAL